MNLAEKLAELALQQRRAHLASARQQENPALEAEDIRPRLVDGEDDVHPPARQLRQDVYDVRGVRAVQPCAEAAPSPDVTSPVKRTALGGAFAGAPGAGDQ